MTVSRAPAIPAEAARANTKRHCQAICCERFYRRVTLHTLIPQRLPRFLPYSEEECHEIITGFKLCLFVWAFKTAI